METHTHGYLTDLYDALWLRQEYHQAHAARQSVHALQARPPFREHVLTPTQRTEALDLLRWGQRRQQAADALGVSSWGILWLLRRTAPKLLPKQQQPSLSEAQADEARALLAAGWSLRKIGRRCGVSCSAIWRLLHRDRPAAPPHKSQLTQSGDTTRHE